jgi:hypothetical protein
MDVPHPLVIRDHKEHFPFGSGESVLAVGGQTW